MTEISTSTQGVNSELSQLLRAGLIRAEPGALQALGDRLTELGDPRSARIVSWFTRPLIEKELVQGVYLGRRDRGTNPEGKFDDGGRWYPSAREEQGDVSGHVRGPSRNWPYSYLLRCRTRQHCKLLVAAALRGEDVPEDVCEDVARRYLIWELFTAEEVNGH